MSQISLTAAGLSSGAEPRDFPRVGAVAGPIGAGKSTLLDELERRYAAAGRDDVLVVREPVAEWEAVADARGENIIQRFYRDPGAHAFAFQTLVCATQVAAMRRAARAHPRCRVLVCERSLSASRHVFAAMMRDEGLFRPLEHEVYCRAFDALAEGALPAQIVYLACPPAVCAARIAGRARAGEEGIPLGYLERCEAYYGAWLAEARAPLLALDAAGGPENAGALAARIAAFVDAFGADVPN